MLTFIARRLAQSVIVIFGVSILAFGVLFLSGDPTYLYITEHANEASILEMRHRLGFDRPVYIQYLTFASRAVRGDFGNSLRFGRPAFDIVLERLPATIELTLAGMFVAVVFAVPIGILAATRRGSSWDGATMLAALAGQSMPQFWLGIMLIILFGLQFKLLPVSGRVPILEPLLAGNFAVLASTLGGAVQHLVLPGVTSGLWSLSRNARLVRSSMLEVLGMDYVRTARAKGLRERTVILRHALKNALLPVITIMGLEFGFLISGDIVVETVFAWPGVGRLVVTAINQKDFNVVQASVVTLAVVFIALNLLVDVLYTYLDPRIRFS
jgi:peptide/nickel transport system permease protein